MDKITWAGVLMMCLPSSCKDSIPHFGASPTPSARASFLPSPLPSNNLRESPVPSPKSGLVALAVPSPTTVPSRLPAPVNSPSHLPSVVPSAPMSLSSPIPVSPSSGTPGGAPTQSPSARPSPSSVPLNKNILLREFLRAQQSELKAIDHQNKVEFKEFKQAQEIREKEWNRSEGEARHKFFETHAQGEERRVYVQDFIQRRDALKKQLQEDRAQRLKEQETYLKGIRENQTVKLKSFKEALEKGTPDTSFWPVH